MRCENGSASNSIAAQIRQPLHPIKQHEKPPSSETYKILYVRSGNECAFPGCNHPIFNDDGLYIAQLCHIKAANVGGHRYDENQTDEQRRAPENLLFMCHRHHKETDSLSVRFKKLGIP